MAFDRRLFRLVSYLCVIIVHLYKIYQSMIENIKKYKCLCIDAILREVLAQFRIPFCSNMYGFRVIYQNKKSV